MIYLIFIAITILSYSVQQSLKSKFQKYSRIPIGGGMRGQDVARRMLSDNRIAGVQVTSTRGTLTDFYNPSNLTVNLSEGVYEANSVAAAAVAAAAQYLHIVDEIGFCHNSFLIGSACCCNVVAKLRIFCDITASPTPATAGRQQLLSQTTQIVAKITSGRGKI